MTERNFAIQIEAILKSVQAIERFGAQLAMLEACETIAGVMAEQGELFALAEKSNEKELKMWWEKVSKKRIYSVHYDAIRDALRLGKLVIELIEQTNEFLEDGGASFIENILEKTSKSDVKG